MINEISTKHMRIEASILRKRTSWGNTIAATYLENAADTIDELKNEVIALKRELHVERKYKRGG